VRISSVAVSVGDEVQAGDVLATLDARVLDAAVEAARARRRAVRAQVGVLDARLDDLEDARSTIAENRVTVRDTISELEQTRADLRDRAVAARAERARIAALLDALPKPGSSPTSPTPLPPGVSPPDPAQLRAALAKLDAGIAQLDAAIAKLDRGLDQARSGLARLEDASARTSDARVALRSVRRVARAGLEGSDAAVALAEASRDLTVLRSPLDGVVIEVAPSGASLPAGSPVAVVRPRDATRVDVWVTPEVATEIAVGDRAAVHIDSRPGEAFAAAVTSVGSRALFPPSWIATTEEHLTRAVPVRVTLEDSAAVLPPGTPADVTISLDL
jgi:multidrug resistance efflux pump